MNNNTGMNGFLPPSDNAGMMGAMNNNQTPSSKGPQPLDSISFGGTSPQYKGPIPNGNPCRTKFGSAVPYGSCQQASLNSMGLVPSGQCQNSIYDSNKPGFDKNYRGYNNISKNTPGSNNCCEDNIDPQCIYNPPIASLTSNNNVYGNSNAANQANVNAAQAARDLEDASVSWRNGDSTPNPATPANTGWAPISPTPAPTYSFPKPIAATPIKPKSILKKPTVVPLPRVPYVPPPPPPTFAQKIQKALSNSAIKKKLGKFTNIARFTNVSNFGSTTSSALGYTMLAIAIIVLLILVWMFMKKKGPFKKK